MVYRGMVSSLDPQLFPGLEDSTPAGPDVPMSTTRGNPRIVTPKGLVGMVGFEPTTSCSRSMRTTKLSYIPMVKTRCVWQASNLRISRLRAGCCPRFSFRRIGGMYGI